MDISFSPAAGVYAEPVEVQLMANGGSAALINCYYTTDGTTPTVSSQRYTAPFLVSASSTVRAIDGDTPSNIAVGLFTVGVVQTTQILLPRGPQASIPTIGSGLLMPEDINILYAADAQGNTQGISDLHIGPNQPLATVRLWHDTVAGVMKYNNGVAWVPQAVVTTPQDFGDFDLPPASAWHDVTSAALWNDTNAVLSGRAFGTNTAGYWDATEQNGAFLIPAGFTNSSGEPGFDRTDLNVGEYESMVCWAKGVKFTKLRITLVGAGEYTVIVNNNWNRTILDTIVFTSGQEIDIAFLTEVDGPFWEDLGYIFIEATSGTLDRVTKIEVLY